MIKWSLFFDTVNLRAIVAVLTAVFFQLYSLRPLLINNSASASARQARRADLEQTYRKLIRPNTDLEAFARLAERAANYSDLSAPAGETVEQFVDDLSWLIMGSPDSLLAIPVSGVGRALEKLHTLYGLTNGYPALMRFGSSGFRVDDKSNQVQHFWFSVIAAYHLGAPLADGIARYHEWNAPGLLDLLPFTGHGRGDLEDLHLSRQGIWLGQALRDGRIQPADVAGWLRSNL